MGPVRTAEMALAAAATRLAKATDAVLDMDNSLEDRENKLWLGAMVALSDYNQAASKLETIQAQLPWSTK